MVHVCTGVCALHFDVIQVHSEVIVYNKQQIIGYNMLLIFADSSSQTQRELDTQKVGKDLLRFILLKCRLRLNGLYRPRLEQILAACTVGVHLCPSEHANKCILNQL